MKITEASLAKREKPKNIKKYDEWLFCKEFEKEFISVELSKLSNCYFSPNGSFLTRWFTRVPGYFNTGLTLKGSIVHGMKDIVSLAKTRRLIKLNNAIIVTNANSTNFFHWFFDVLPKLECIADPVFGFADFIVFVPSNHAAPYIYETLSAFGVQCFFQKDDEFVFFENCTVFPELAPTGNYIKSLIEKQRLRLIKFFRRKMDFNKAPKRVYITRKSAKYRRLTNEVLIFPVLKEYGFIIVDMDAMPFLDQVKLMFDADLLVSLHGAGLSHMLWMKSGGDVFEIRSKGDSHNNCYYSLSSDLGLNYWYSFANKLGNKSVQVSDHELDLENFLDVLKKIMSKI
ncbi:MAG: glycosyltransferase family 61 protein [Methylicorpusculum sp.]|uniref:glycosyltransferase family 61 protein n=1 Tax=Methylicorpusculum sp. TaxID=2713644 RepID=UPI00271ED8E4|nr:glycosyltransferase family 61 protein [Methylicorpusculum sp.]MDO8938776.1 glycosyltransferase family 61 protein [Methylicorpusculum sp.]MDP2201249.1 glycosyltransferase family 61 protein [Methylicorpusculum sp.]